MKDKKIEVKYYTKIYGGNVALGETRYILEKEFRQQYDIACDNSHLEWQMNFKNAFEKAVESLADLSKLI